MSRRDQILQAVDSVQNQVYGFIDSRAGPAQRPGSSSHASSVTRTRPIQRDNSVATTAALPLYSTRPEPNSEQIPSEALRAAPGHAQEVVDQLPRNRMARGSGREARLAAAALREEQLRTGQLKTRHTFVASGGRVLLDINTVPQKTLTFMGGSAERRRGAMAGTVTVHAQPNERVSAIRLKVKAIVRILVPKSGTPQTPFVLERSHPSVEPSVEKEVLLLQLESQLYTAPPAGNSNTDPTLLSPGKHEYPFSIDLPSENSKGVPLPPSFVLAPTNTADQVQRPAPRNKWESITSSIPIPHLTSDWASVKWYVKVTVERPGIFRANERIFAPFVYLPPPPPIMKGAEDLLLKRLKLANDVESLLRRFQANQGSRPIDLQKLVEPFSKWESLTLNHGIMGRHKSKVGAANSKSDKPGLFSRLMFGAQVEQESHSSVIKETFTISLPKRPFVFALRSGVPYVLSRTVEWKGRGNVTSEMSSRLPNVALFQRANLYGRSNGPIAATTARLVATGQQPPDRNPVFTEEFRSGAGMQGKVQVNRKTEHWLGTIDLPPTCAPCFETPVLVLHYYLGVRSPVSNELIHCEPIVLVCPPSKAIRTKAPTNVSGSRRTSASMSSTPKHSGRNSEGSVMRTTTSTSTAHTSPLAHQRAGTSAPVTVAHSSSSSSQPTRMSAALEKRALQQRRQQSEISSPSQTSGSAGVSTSAAAVTAATAVQPSPHGQQSSQSAPTPSGTLTPLVPSRTQTPVPSQDQTSTLQNDTEDEMDNWAFQDDELTDLPPSYFEATGVRDQD